MQVGGERMEIVTDFILGGFKITADGDCIHEIKTLAPWKKSYDQPWQHIKKKRHYFANISLFHQSYGFSSSHVWMWELDCTESCTPKNWYFWTVVLEETLESPLGCKEIQTVHPKGIQSWIFIERTDAGAETPILWAPDVKNWLTGEKPWCWQKLNTGGEGEDRGWDGWMASPTRWTWVWVNSGSSDGQESLVCCSPWGRKELDTIEWLKSTELPHSKYQ